MKYVLLYGLFLFVGLPMIMFTTHIVMLPDDQKQALAETAKDLNGRIYQARISCGRGSDDYIHKVHGRDPEDARRKMADQLPKCDIEIMDSGSAPIWLEAWRSAF